MTYQNGQRNFMVELVYQNQSGRKFNLILIVSRKERQIDEADVTLNKCYEKKNENVSIFRPLNIAV